VTILSICGVIYETALERKVKIIAPSFIIWHYQNSQTRFQKLILVWHQYTFNISKRLANYQILVANIRQIALINIVNFTNYFRKTTKPITNSIKFYKKYWPAVKRTQ